MKTVWSGALDEVTFLGRLYDLEAIPKMPDGLQCLVRAIKPIRKTYTPMQPGATWPIKVCPCRGPSLVQRVPIEFRDAYAAGSCDAGQFAYGPSQTGTAQVMEDNQMTQPVRRPVLRAAVDALVSAALDDLAKVDQEPSFAAAPDFAGWHRQGQESFISRRKDVWQMPARIPHYRWLDLHRDDRGSRGDRRRLSTPTAPRSTMPTRGWRRACWPSKPAWWSSFRSTRSSPSAV